METAWRGEQLRVVVDALIWALPSQVAVLDRDGTIVAVNEAWKRFARDNGAPDLAEHSIGVNYLEICRRAAGPSVEGAQAAYTGLLAVLNRSQPLYTLEYPCHSPSERRWFLLYAAPLPAGREGAVVSHVNITERKLAEEELAGRASQMEAMFEAMIDGMILCDKEGRIVRANRAFQDLLALDRCPDYYAMSPQEHLELLALRDMQGRPLLAAQMPLTRALRGEVIEGPTTVDVRMRALDGRELDANITAAPVRDSAGRIEGAVAVFRDVTERRQLEAERAHLMSMVSHELKAPLAVIGLANSVIRRRAARQQPASPDALIHLNEGVARMTRLVNDLVDASGLDTDHLTLQRAPTDLRDLCYQVAGEQMGMTGRLVTLDLPQEPVQLDLDAVRINQVLANLLSNALKYSPPDRSVSVRLRRTSGAVCVEVRDEGPGIPAEAQSHIFERFYRVPGIQVQHGSGVGLGLGLYICRRLVELHGGTVGVESSEGKGSTFWFTLPQA